MRYELMVSGSCVGLFPTESEARHHVAYMPKGNYTLRKWAIDGDFMVCNLDVNAENLTINKTYDYE